MFMVVRNRPHPDPLLKGGGNREVVEKYSDKKQSLDKIVAKDSRVSLDIADVVNHYEKIKTTYNRIYYVSDGLMQVHINNQELILQKGDACFVEKGMIVELLGTFAVIIVSSPSLRV